MKSSNFEIKTSPIYLIFSILIVLFGSLFTGSLLAKELNDWKIVKSENLELYTDYDDEIAIDTLKKFEIFRAVTLNLLKSDTKQNLLPVKIFLFKTENMWKNLKFSSGNRGYFHNSVYGPQMFVRPLDDELNLQTLYHEYVHYLLMTNSPIAIAPWYNEGIADFFSTMIIEDDFVYIGKVNAGRAKALKRFGFLKLQEVLGTTALFEKKSKFKRIFYPSAWLTTHYFTLGARNGFSSHYTSSMKLLELQSQGLDINTAFTQSFDISMRDLQREIKKYARTGSKEGVAMPIPEVKVSSTITRMTSREVKSALAPVFGWRNKSGLGYKYLNEAAEGGDSFALSVKAIHFANQNKIDASLAIIKALEVKSDLNHATLHNIAISYRSMAQRASKTNNIQLALAHNTKAKQHLVDSLKRAEYLPSYVELANYVALYESKETAMEIVAAMLKFSPNQYWARRTAAEVYIKVNEIELAIENIASASRLTGHNEQAQKSLNALLKSLLL